MPTPAEVQTVMAALVADGYKPKKAKPDPALSENGPYVVWGMYHKEGVDVTFEQNSVQETVNGASVLTTYPSVAIVEYQKVRVACDATDLQLITDVVRDLIHG